MLGSLTAILIAGALNLLGKRKPHLTGEGRLQPSEQGELQASNQDLPADLHVNDIVAAGLFAISLYLLGLLCNKLFGLPAPVSMLFITVLVKLARAVTPQLQAGAFFVFRFFQVGVTYPLLFAIGVAMTPWETLMAAFVPTKAHHHRGHGRHTRHHRLLRRQVGQALSDRCGHCKRLP